MKIYVTSLFVDDQQSALEFYTQKLGFEVKHDIPLGEYRWLTLTEPNNPDGVELLLEPKGHPATDPFTSALYKDGIPFKSLQVDDIQAEFNRLSEQGVKFTMEPMDMGAVFGAVFDDTCGNLIQLVQFK